MHCLVQSKQRQMPIYTELIHTALASENRRISGPATGLACDMRLGNVAIALLEELVGLVEATHRIS